MGPAAYAELELRCEAHLASVKAVRSNGARRLLPLLVHPATLAARAGGATPADGAAAAARSVPSARSVP